MAEKDRKRETNFTNFEIDLLLQLCNKNKKILENKTTNAVTWKEKTLAWDKIHSEFNSATEGPSRTIKTLRTKYDSMKKEVRKSVDRQKNYVTGTGGGPFIREEKLSPALEQLHQNIKISSDGLICPFDSDSIDISNSNNIDESDNNIIVEELDYQDIMMEENNFSSSKNLDATASIRVDFSDYSASMLQTPKPKELKYVRTQSPTTETELDKRPSTSASLFEKSNSLEQTRKVFPKRKATVSSVANKYNDLCTSKAELVQRELRILDKKEQQDTIEHELRVKKLKLETEKLELELLLLKKSIQP